MKTHNHHPKLKTQSRPLFSCGFFRHCTQTALSPTTPDSPSLPLPHSASPAPHPPPSPPPPPPLPPPHHSPPPPPPPPQPNPPSHKHQQPESSSSSSSSTSQSFTQWRFPLANSPIHHYHHHKPDSQHDADSKPDSTLAALPLPIVSTNLQELFHAAELQLSSGSDSEQVAALHLLERSLVPNPPSDPACPPELMRGLVANLKKKAGAKPATKILLALCLAEANRHVAVEAGAVGSVVEAAMELESAAAERALAALELMCTVAEGAEELRAHALAVPVMVAMMGKMAGRGREYAISALSVIYGNGGATGEDVQHAPPEEVGRAVALVLRGDCTARGRRKGAQLLEALEEYGRLDLTHEEFKQLDEGFQGVVQQSWTAVD